MCCKTILFFIDTILQHIVLKLTYSPLGQVFEKQAKAIEDRGKKQVEALTVLKPNKLKLTIKNAITEDHLNEEAKNEIEKN